MRSYHPAKFAKILIFLLCTLKNSNFRKFCWVMRPQPISVLKLFLFYLKYVFLNLLLQNKNQDQSGPYQIDFWVEFWSQKSFVLCHNMAINNYCRIIKMSLIIDELSSFFMAFWRQLGRRGVFRLLTFFVETPKKRLTVDWSKVTGLAMKVFLGTLWWPTSTFSQ